MSMKIITPSQLKIAAHASKDQLKLAIAGILVDADTQEVAATNGHVLVRVKPSKKQLGTQAPDIDSVMPKTEPKAVATFNGQYLESVLKTFAQLSGNDWKRCPYVKVELWGPEEAARFTLYPKDESEVVALVMPLRATE